MSLDPKELRRALGLFATGVCVVSIQSPSGPVGITINSFTSVSLDPPLILWCLDKKSERFAVFSAARQFCINILGAHQVSAAKVFAGMETKPIEPFFDLMGVPLIKQSPVILSCRHWSRYDGGDHIILVGEVLDIISDNKDPSAKALTYYKAQFGDL